MMDGSKGLVDGKKGTHSYVAYQCFACSVIWS